MRIGVTFEANKALIFPINQNYFLSSAVYSALESRPEYAKFLHDHGYEHEPSGRRFKLFVFSPLLCRRREIRDESIIMGPGQIRWLISSPMTDFITALAEGLLSKGEVDVRGTRLAIKTVDAEPEPEFARTMSFVCLSSIVVSRPDENGGYAHFCTNDDPDFSERVRFNLIRKYELIYGRRPDDEQFEMVFDPDYISRRQGKITKLTDIRGTQIRGILAPFTTTGSPALLQIGYHTGFGERGSMGFGCVDVNCK
jgi:CRISPR-associated endoribonuclease Cas6